MYKNQKSNPEEKYEKYKLALELLDFHERKVEYYKKITRQYIYAMEAERVKNKKIDSERYYREQGTRSQ